MELTDIIEEYAWLIRYLVRKKVNTAKAEDIIQDIFVAICRNYETLEDERYIGRWIRTVVRNRIADHYRSTGRNTRKKTAYAAYSSCKDSWSSRDPSLWIEQMDARKLLDKLPETYREIMILRYLKECTVAEIAVQLKMKPATISNRLSYAKKILREKIGKKSARNSSGRRLGNQEEFKK